jgi:hypothetical protein
VHPKWRRRFKSTGRIRNRARTAVVLEDAHHIAASRVEATIRI